MGSLVIHLCAGGQSPCADSNKLWRSIMCEEKQSCLAAAHRPCSSPPFFPVWKLLKSDIASPGSLNNWWSLSKPVGYWCSNLPSLLTYRVWRLYYAVWRRGKCAQKFAFNRKSCGYINSVQNSEKLKPLPLCTDITNVIKMYYFFCKLFFKSLEWWSGFILPPWSS